jgi:hypothetical protein
MKKRLPSEHASLFPYEPHNQSTSGFEVSQFFLPSITVKFRVVRIGRFERSVVSRQIANVRTRSTTPRAT